MITNQSILPQFQWFWAQPRLSRHTTWIVVIIASFEAENGPKNFFVVRGDRTRDLALQAKTCGFTCKRLLRLAFFRLISAPWYSGSLVGSPWGFSGRHFLWPGSNPAFLKGISIQTAPAPLLGLQHAAIVPGRYVMRVQGSSPFQLKEYVRYGFSSGLRFRAL